MCLSHYVFCVWETSDLSLGTPDHCLLHHYIHWYLTILRDLIWVDYSFIFFQSICFSHHISFALSTLFFIHIDLHSVFNIFHILFLYIPSVVRYYSFLLFLHWYIDIFSFFFIDISMDVLRSMVYETLCMYCILYMRVWGFIIGIIEPSFLSFLHLIILAYVTSRVLRPPWGHDITHCVW